MPAPADGADCSLRQRLSRFVDKQMAKRLRSKVSAHAGKTGKCGTDHRNRHIDPVPRRFDHGLLVQIFLRLVPDDERCPDILSVFIKELFADPKRGNKQLRLRDPVRLVKPWIGQLQIVIILIHIQRLRPTVSDSFIFTDFFLQSRDFIFFCSLPAVKFLLQLFLFFRTLHQFQPAHGNIVIDLLLLPAAFLILFL